MSFTLRCTGLENPTGREPVEPRAVMMHQAELAGEPRNTHGLLSHPHFYDVRDTALGATSELSNFSISQPEYKSEQYNKGALSGRCRSSLAQLMNSEATTLFLRDYCLLGLLCLLSVSRILTAVCPLLLSNGSPHSFRLLKDL